MASPNFMNMENASGVDVVCNNVRTRALSTAGTNALGTMYMQGTGTPTALAGTNQTVTAARLLTGIITGTPTGAATYTMDTAANIVTAMNNASAGVQVGDYLECLVVNDSAASTITLAPDGGSTTTFNRANNLTITAGQSFWLLLRVTAVGASPTVLVFH